MIVYGKQIFMQVINEHPHLIEEVYLSKEIGQKIFSKIAKLNKKIIKLDSKKAQAMAHGGNHQGYFLSIAPYKYASLQEIKNSNFIVVLYNITDVGNIGSIIRSAHALGVDAVVISGIAHIKTEAVIRSSSGAMFEMPVVIYKDTITLLNELKQVGHTVYCANMNATDVRKTSFETKKTLVMGSEGEGISNKILKICDQEISIQMQNKFDSLNVSVATAILCDRMR